MNSLKINLMILLAVSIAACRPETRQVQEVRDSRLIVQLVRINAGATAYKCKIVPVQEGITNSGRVSNQMLYHADSCFYLLDNGKPKYAVAVQPVANGIKGSYEYLLQWDAAGPVSLVFDDKYLYSRKYTFKIKD
ncbi:hypothetical protein KXD93_10885 [Mucilaginibacter sp. BJC16-A38]|uniref:hypothetical protein n=1 Tax=Mucilaginibacter phenanthrenivorans TaxID=1234842 RepID=UPI002156FAB2|nr:hypothetical protein [Mucilaginibacter phenanthrenivorans]MCR8558153.1 hypothetical protein [Mucilaginibacter phenanthrenivorans]